MDLGNVVDIARRTLMDATLGPSSRLEEAAGYDSLTHLQFILEVEKRSGQKIHGDIAETATLTDIMAMLMGQA